MVLPRPWPPAVEAVEAVVSSVLGFLIKATLGQPELPTVRMGKAKAVVMAQVAVVVVVANLVVLAAQLLMVTTVVDLVKMAIV
jgi:hypothetical protein